MREGKVFGAYSIVTVAVAWGIDCDVAKRLATVARNISHSLADIS